MIKRHRSRYLEEKFNKISVIRSTEKKHLNAFKDLSCHRTFKYVVQNLKVLLVSVFCHMKKKHLQVYRKTVSQKTHTSSSCKHYDQIALLI